MYYAPVNNINASVCLRVVLNRVMAFAIVWMQSTSPYARIIFWVHKEKKDEDENKNNMRWTTSPPLPKVVKSSPSSSVNDTTIFRENWVATVEAVLVVERADEWILGYKL